MSFHKMLFKSLVVFILVSGISGYSYGQRERRFFRKDYSYIESTEAFYKVHTLPKTWLDAKKQCSLEGAVLFYPEDEREAHSVISFWTSSQSFDWLYVGISDLVAKGVYVTVDGIPISNVFHNWAPGEPNDLGGAEDCVVMKKVAHYNDDNCNKRKPFICKKTFKSLQWNSNCNLPNLDYRLNETLGKCYNLHTTPVSWVEAYTICAAEQAYLSVVNSPSEAEYLVELAKTAPTEKVTGNYLSGAIHSGFHNRFNDGWQTIKAVPLDKSGYTYWDENQPDGEPGEQCGSMFYNERLNDITCEIKSIFICEYDVDMTSLGSQFGETTPVY